MSSPKQKDYNNGKIRTDNLTTIYMKSKDKLYGTLRFNCMIPILETELKPYSINDEGDFNYKMLMLAEYNFCKSNREKIERTAKNLYTKKQKNEKSLESLLKVVVDFQKLEILCKQYQIGTI